MPRFEEARPQLKLMLTQTAACGILTQTRGSFSERNKYSVKKDLVKKLAVISAVIGLGVIFAVMLSGAAYPDALFRIGAPLGLAFVAVSVVLLAISWIMEIYSGIKSRNYVWAVAAAALGLMVIALALIRALG